MWFYPHPRGNGDAENDPLGVDTHEAWLKDNTGRRGQENFGARRNPYRLRKRGAWDPLIALVLSFGTIYLAGAGMPDFIKEFFSGRGF